MSVYRVTGKLRYREHKPGELFVAELDKDVEERALRVGAIEVVERTSVHLDIRRAKPPRGWR